MSQKTERPLKILHSEAAIAFGGQEHRIYKEMIAMRERGHHVELACRPQAQLVQKMRDQGFTVHLVPMGGIVNFIKGVFSFRRILKEGQFDVLNTHSRKDTLIAALGGRLAGTPLIVRTRHLAIKIGSLLSYTWLPHRVSTVSEYVRKMVLAKGVPSYKVKTIFSPVQVPEPIEKSTLRDELGLSDDDIVAICVAVMREKKGHLFLLDAMESFFKENPHLHLVCVGAGSPTFEKVQAWVKDHHLEKQVHLLGYRKDVPNLLKGADFFVLATEQEASGTVYVEAQMAGLPVIGTDVGGVSEMFIPNKTGLLVPSLDKPALKAALSKMIHDPDFRKELAQNGQHWIFDEQVFSTQKLAENTEKAYYTWLEERKQGK